MKTIKNFILVMMFCAATSLVQAQTVEWTRQLGTSSNDVSNSVTTDSLGNIYISGYTSGNLAGPGSQAGSYDAFLAKYNSSGKLTWTRQLGTSLWEQSNSVTADSLGNVYISGLDKGADAFLAKYDSRGNLTWTRQLKTSLWEQGNGVTTDSLGNVYISGWTSGDLDGSGPGTNAGSLDAFLTKYDSSGNLTWTRQLGTSGSEISSSVATDFSGNVYISGHANGSGSDISSDAFLTKYDSSGNLAWTRQLGTSGRDDKSHSVTTDPLGNIYLSGLTRGDLDGSGSGTYAGETDAFLVKYNTAGQLLWTKQLGTSSSDISSSVTADSLGNVYLSGYTNGDLDGAGPGTNAGETDAFVAKYNTAGQLIWTKQLGTSGDDISNGVAADSLGNVYLSGRTDGNLAGPWSFFGGFADAFLVKIHDDSFAPLLEGDYDQDGDVDNDDFIIWKVNFGSTTFFAADGNKNGIVDTADFTVWRDHLGDHVGSVGNANAVPEPSALILMLLGIGSLVALRRKS